MSAFLAPLFGAGWQGFDNQGNVLAGGKLYTYQAGTTSPYATWSDFGLTIPNGNPIILNSAGRPSSEIWFDSSSYKVVLTDTNNNIIGTWDNLVGMGSGSPGPQGNTGPQGPQGFTGAQGPLGFGPSGTDGMDGDDGQPIPGPKGNTGAQGVQGVQGVQGLTGPYNMPGVDGVDGDDGMQIPGAGTLGGTLNVANGGTGVATLTGIAYGNGTSAFTAASTAQVLSVIGTVPIANGGTASTTLAANNVLLGNGTSALQVVSPSTSGNVLTSNGTTWQSTALPAAGVTVTNDTTTATALYPTFTSATTGSISGLSVTSTKYTFVPTTGALTAPEIVASNGLVVNNATVSTSFTIPTGYNATATGPMTIASGAVVSIPAGSRWMIL